MSSRLTPIHHAMARAMPVSGGPPRVGDSIRCGRGENPEVILAVRFDARGPDFGYRPWRVRTDRSSWMPVCRGDRILPAPRLPPSGGFGRLAR